MALSECSSSFGFVGEAAYSLREVRFVLSLNDDGESNVLEVIQNLELLLDLREASWIMFLCFGLEQMLLDMV